MNRREIIKVECNGLAFQMGGENMSLLHCGPHLPYVFFLSICTYVEGVDDVTIWYALGGGGLAKLS